MKLQNVCFSARVSVLAVRGALLALAFTSAAHAAETAAENAALAELVNPASSVDIGLGNVGSRSAKFGEYNGLGKSGAVGIGNVDLYGGGAYDSNDATRWRVRGNNLGLETRDLSVDYGVQGKFKLNFGYGELLHNLSDSYQTPYLGTGRNNLTLPSTWLKPWIPQNSTPATTSATAPINFRALSPVAGVAPGTNRAATAADLTALQGIRNADLSSFQNFDLKNKRTTYDAGFGFNLSPQWELSASYRHEQKNGAKPIGAISTKSGFESTLILPDPIGTTTDQLNLGVQYTGDGSFLQFAYYGSMFKNSVKSLTWQDPSNLALASTQSSGSGPDNQFHQLNLTGGHNFSQATKVVMNASYGRNTQNDAFLTDTQLPLGSPRSSLDGLVVTKGLNLKLTARPAKGLNLATRYKFDDRDNRSPVDTYAFYDINVAGTGTSVFNAALSPPAGTTLGTNINIYNNRPQSKRVNQFNLDGDYVVAKGHTLAAGYEFQKIDRSCNGTWIACVDADTTKENTLRAEWRARLSEDVSSKVGYAHSRRNVNYNENAWLALAPMANVVPSTAAANGSAGVSAYQFLLQRGLSGWGPHLGGTGLFPVPAPATNPDQFYTPGNNIVTSVLYGSRNQLAENPRMRRFNLADRNRDKLRSSLNWEATERVSLYGGLDLNLDDYSNSPLGLRNAKGWALNLDGAYALSDALGFSMFYTHENQRSSQNGWNYVANAAAGASTTITGEGSCFDNTQQRNVVNKVDPCNAWSMDMRDRADTFGMTLRHKNLMRGKLDLGGSLIYSRARTDMAVRGGNYVADPSNAANVLYILATDLPTVSSRSVELRLSGQYAIDKSSSVRMLYAVKRLKTEDFAYEGAQPGVMTSFIPTYDQSPQYTVHLVGISYAYRF